MKSRGCVAIALVVLASGAGNAFSSPCETEYRRFQSILTASHLPEGLHRRIVAKSAAGWSAFGIGAGATKLASTNLSDASAALALDAVFQTALRFGRL